MQQFWYGFLPRDKHATDIFATYSNRAQNGDFLSEEQTAGWRSNVLQTHHDIVTPDPLAGRSDGILYCGVANPRHNAVRQIKPHWVYSQNNIISEVFQQGRVYRADGRFDYHSKGAPVETIRQASSFVMLKVLFTKADSTHPLALGISCDDELRVCRLDQWASHFSGGKTGSEHDGVYPSHGLAISGRNAGIVWPHLRFNRSS